MPYTIFKTNGVRLTVIEDGKLNLITDLQLVGKNYAGYGQVVNENFVKLLENFSNNTSPLKPLVGQLWYDSANKKVKVYTGTKWNQFLPTTISNTRPSDLAEGEFWYDSLNYKLYLKLGNSFRLIGPGSSAISNTGTGSSLTTSQVLSDTAVIYDIIKLQIGAAIVGIVSDQTFNVDPSDPIFANIAKIYKGFTLIGSDPTTGVSDPNGTYFWGTAADAKKLDGRPVADFLLASQVNLVAGNITELGNLTRISTGSPSTPGTIEGDWSLTPGSTLEASWADLAERYEADAEYEPGTVLVIGGEKEVTISKFLGDTAVAGVVSTNPAFKMNADAGSDSTHPYLALKGRIPCKVVGEVKKGDFLITSNIPGVAISAKKMANPNCVIGRALENYNSEEVGLIEIKV